MPDKPLSDYDHSISLQTAIDMTTLYREKKDAILHPDYLGKDILPIAETFNNSILQGIMSQPDCIGLRFYYSMSPDFQLHLIICGVDSHEQDILEGTALLAEDSKRCPPICRSTSLLNP